MTFTYEKPKSVGEAIALIGASAGKFPVLAGGTDILAQLKSNLIELEGVIDISSIDELKGIRETEDAIEIRALATHSKIEANDAVQKHLPVLAEGCNSIGSIQIRNRGTIGGNIMNASPAGDLLPVILALGAEIKAQDLKGERWIDAGDLYTGYRKTSLKSGELLTAVRFPKPDPEDKIRFYKVGGRAAHAISKVVMCARARIWHGGVEEIAIAIGSVAPTVVRATATEILVTKKPLSPAFIEQVRHCLEDEVHPIDDVRSTADYRRHICGSLLVKFLREATKTVKSI